jgi:hypothetical protein
MGYIFSGKAYVKHTGERVLQSFPNGGQWDLYGANVNAARFTTTKAFFIFGFTLF